LRDCIARYLHGAQHDRLRPRRKSRRPRYPELGTALGQQPLPEPHLRLPESFRDLEGAIREALRQGLSRGKVECTLRFVEETAGKPLQVDLERAGQLIAAAESVAGLIKQPAALNPLEVLAWPGVLVADARRPDEQAGRSPDRPDH